MSARSLRALHPYEPAFFLCFRVLAETDSEVEIAHSDDSDIVGSLSWTAPLHDIEPVTEETMSEDVFTLPHTHRSFKEYIGNKTDLGRAVIPAAILAGYTGEEIRFLCLIRIQICCQTMQQVFNVFFQRCLNRQWSHSAVAVSAGAPHRPQLSVMYQLDRRWLGVQADGP